MESKTNGAIRLYRRAQSHLSKSGTPTMGGTLILFAICVSLLLWADLTNRFVVGAAFYTGGLWSGGLGGRLPAGD